MVTCYLDESGTDSNSIVAVVGGLVLDLDQFSWIDIEWRGSLERLSAQLKEPGLCWPLHMKDFGQHGKLGHLRSEARRLIFTELVEVANHHKLFSISCRLESSHYRRNFQDVTRFSMYGAAFLVVALVNCRSAVAGGNNDEIAYLLDTGNRYRNDVLQVKDFLKGPLSGYPANMGPVAFESDGKVAALQVADMVSFAVRRKNDQGLNSGYEPLEDLLRQPRHVDAAYHSDEMAKVADDLRAYVKEEKSNEANA